MHVNGSSCSHGVKKNHVGVVIAFLNGVIIHDFYIEQPEGYEGLGKEEFVCKLLKPLYGLKQAPIAWYSNIDSFLSKKGLLKSCVDYNLYNSKDYIHYVCR